MEGCFRQCCRTERVGLGTSPALAGLHHPHRRLGVCSPQQWQGDPAVFAGLVRKSAWPETGPSQSLLLSANRLHHSTVGWTPESEASLATATTVRARLYHKGALERRWRAQRLSSTALNLLSGLSSHPPWLLNKRLPAD